VPEIRKKLHSNLQATAPLLRIKRQEPAHFFVPSTSGPGLSSAKELRIGTGQPRTYLDVQE
jgi:hypothetical protein